MKVQAPGKLMIAGEYAVLLGAPSIVAAVDRYVTGEVVPGAGYQLAGATAGLALPKAALEAAGRPELLDGLRVDVSQLYAPDGQKLGLGSSAASIVAICRAAGIESNLLEVALEAHHALQGGAGSGADVAASALGGVLGYQLRVPNLGGWASISQTDVEASPVGARGEVDERVGGGSAQRPPRIRGITLPTNLRVEAVWLGEPASSTVLIGQVLAAGEAQVRPAMQRIQAAALQMIEACDANNSQLFLGAVKGADAAMVALGEAAGAPIIVPEHVRLREKACKHGLVCKPSGAGGGDFSLVFGVRDADWDAFLEGLVGHTPLVFGAKSPG